jgi:DNA-binding NarL/FixJ family response regulator
MPTQHILVIEDQAEMRRNVAFILEQEGFRVSVAANGAEGLRLAKSVAPDLILCDVTMPGIDGHQVLDLVRDTPVFAHTPFVFLTARGEREDIRKGMALGADDYLSKPFNHDELMACVRGRLERAASMRDASPKGTRSAPDFSRTDILVERFALTPREAEVLSWLAQGKTNGEIATLLGMTERTAKHHVGRCFEKMHCENRSTATLMAAETLSLEGARA